MEARVEISPWEYAVTWVQWDGRAELEPVRPSGDGWEECRWQLLDRWRDKDGDLVDGYQRVWVWRRPTVMESPGG